MALLAACGITPDAVAGHSVGEVAAAYAAGVLTLEDACALVAARARLMQALPGGGAMTAVAATEAEVTAALDGVAGAGIAAVNGPASVVISGDADAVEQVAELFADQGRRTRRLRVSHAFHSHRMDPVLGELGQVAAGLAYAQPRVPWACGLSGQLMPDCGPGYWVRQAREPVRFANAVATLAAQGVSVFLEIGPDGTLCALGSAAVPEATDGGESAVFIPVLRPDQPGPQALPAALARAYVCGTRLDWPAVLGRGQRVDLPTYAFQHRRYWPEPPQVVVLAGRDGAESVAEAQFWAAVEGGDAPALAEALAVDGRQSLQEVLPALAAWRRRERDRSVTDSWRYRVTWVPVPDPEPTVLSGTWLVVAPAALPRGDLVLNACRPWRRAAPGWCSPRSQRKTPAGQCWRTGSPRLWPPPRIRRQPGRTTGPGPRQRPGSPGWSRCWAWPKRRCRGIQWCLRGWRGRWRWCRRWATSGYPRRCGC